MTTHSRRLAALALVPLCLSFAVPLPEEAVGSEVLASAGFEGDDAGATARPNGPPTVSEEVYDASTGTGGESEVVAYGSAKRYRLDAAGVSGGNRAIRLPFSSEVTSGTLTVNAVLTAEQCGDGGWLAVQDPKEEDWLGRAGFGDDGKFSVHGSSTNVSYSADTRYRVIVTVHLGSSTTTDYSIIDLSTNTQVLSTTGRPVAGQPTAGSLLFTTDDGGAGAYTIDNVEAVR